MKDDNTSHFAAEKEKRIIERLDNERKRQRFKV